MEEIFTCSAQEMCFYVSLSLEKCNFAYGILIKHRVDLFSQENIMALTAVIYIYILCYSFFREMKYNRKKPTRQSMTKLQQKFFAQILPLIN